MSIQKLLAVFIAVAVLFAPAFSRSGEAFAAVPDHHAQMMEAGHCDEAPADSDDDDSAEKSCCVSMSMGVAATLPAHREAATPAPAPAVAAIAALHLSYLGEIATPPPKFA